MNKWIKERRKKEKRKKERKKKGKKVCPDERKQNIKKERK